MCDYILETTIEDLQLLFGEVSLGFQLVESLGPVTHHRHLELIICFICREEKESEIEENIFNIQNHVSTSTAPVLHVIIPVFRDVETQERDNSVKSHVKNVIRQQKRVLMKQQGDKAETGSQRGKKR